MNELFHDAFGEEKEQIVYGKDITTSNSTFGFSDLSDVPTPKTNNVSFMKIEEIDAYCRNILAVSDKYICYSVTSKRNLLRVIDTFSGEKTLLRGHESSILDVKISPVDASVLCSVDKGSNPAVPHTIVWKKPSDSALDFLAVLKLPISATIVQPHPVSAHVWAISNNTSIGIFSTAKETTEDSVPISYDTLSAHINMEVNVIVTEMVFSSDGASLICALQSTTTGKRFMQVYQLTKPVAEKLSLIPVYNQYHLLPSIEGLVTLNVIGPYVLTICDIQSFAFSSTNATNGEEMLQYQVKVWSIANTTEPPKAIQTITLELPKSTQKIVNRNLFQLPYLEICCKVETKIGKQQHVLISSRKSAYVVCLAVIPGIREVNNNNNNNNAEVVLPLYHVTYLNLTCPVLTMDITTILGREHHSSEEGEHLGISCYQERDQSSIQQYHTLTSTVYDYATYLKAATTAAVTAVTAPSPGVSINPSLSHSNSTSNLLGDEFNMIRPVTAAARADPTFESRTILKLLKSMNAANLSSSSSEDEKEDEVSVAAISPSSTKSLGSDALNTPGIAVNIAVDNTAIIGSASSGSQLDLAKKVITPSMFQKKSLLSSEVPAVAITEEREVVGPTTTMTVDRSVLTSLQQQSTSAAAALAANATTPETNTPAVSSSLGSVKKLDTKKLFGKSDNNAVANVPVPVPHATVTPIGPPAVPIATVTTATTTTTTTSSATPDLNELLNRKPVANKSLLSMLGVKTTATTTVAPIAAPVVVPVAVPASNLERTVTPVVVDDSYAIEARVTVIVEEKEKKVVEPLVIANDEEEEDNTAMMAPLSATTTVKSPSPKSIPVSLMNFENTFSSSAVPVGQQEELNAHMFHVIQQLQAQLASVVQTQERMEQQQQQHVALTTRVLRTASSHQQQSIVANAAAASSPQKAPVPTAPPAAMNQHTEQILVAAIDNMKLDVLTAVKASNTTKALISVQSGLSTAMQIENKKISEQLTKAKQEITLQLMEYMQTKLVPQITSKVKESVKDSMKDNMKTVLADAFRNSFESSLLPAFQVGTDRLFAQMNVAFEQGLSKLEQDAQLIQQSNIQSYGELENEVTELKDRIKSLEETITTLTLVIQNGVVVNNTGIESNGTLGNEVIEEVVDKKPTPTELLQQGLIADAVRSALELKDICETVSVLHQLTPQQINLNCSNLIRLCITQQLAADMSVNIPMEGIARRIEWIKYLVLSLVRISDSEMERDLALSRNFKTMISAVLESIQAGKALILNAQFDDGEENAIEIPQSVETDLQLLECVIQSKC